jgi:sugar phosphate isomerase/epimerase
MKVGLQLYSVREHFKQDPVGTLKKVAAMGYRYVELYGHPEKGDETTFGLGLPRKEAKALLNDLGLTVVGAHFYPLMPECLDEYCDYFAELGVTQVGCGGTWELDIAEKAPLLNDAGRITKKHGIRYYYHNHYQEYYTVNGEYVLHKFARETDPELVFFELDNFWAARGGVDPTEEMAFFGDRLLLLHQKDFSKNASRPLNAFELVERTAPVSMEAFVDTRPIDTFAEVGTGILPIQSYIDKGNEVGVPYILVEQDMTTLDEIDSVRISMENLHRLTGLEWE